MRAGKKHKRFLLQRRGASVLDAEGRPQDSWVDVGYLWAAPGSASVLAQAASGRELEMAGQSEQRRALSLTIGHRDDVDHTCRLLSPDRSRIIDILTATDPTELRVDLILQCEENIGGGGLEP